MSIIKHKIFKIKVSDDGKFTISKTVENTIDTFLSEPNNIYVNHSVTTLTEDIEEYDNLKTICKYILISIIYKDLNSTSFNLKGVSKKIKVTVQREIESGSAIEEPNILTELDKEIIELESKSEKEKESSNNI
ncbi:MAG: hypothetical protein CMP76_16170 [Flavobacterium sp.]|uniref:hypothetical protein n=1 Tax=Flavobacterium sp. TaxID=239 RepID=UPI000C4C37A0|nr:hypothetical protein [Flavobacterium sp.]MBF04818.1 hypothetical protein [Flavobacterium sp.]|tara:strand:+ start:2000 stop:2398 length:399 start_codon:yes stop_codon:yes gene_type:complete